MNPDSINKYFKNQVSASGEFYDVKELFNQWCKETKRSGGVLVGSSIKSFFDWLDDKGYKLTK